MARYTGPKDKLSRRQGADLFGKGPKLRRINVPPGMGGHRRLRKLSDFGAQLREKQKAKRIYGVLEKQFKRYYEKATRERQATGEALLQQLEARLDNVVYRLGFAPSRAAARQMVNHGHVLVEGEKVDIPSYQVKPGQVINLAPRAMEIVQVKEALAKKDVATPVWLERKAGAGKVARLPKRDDILEDIAEQLIVEFYSR